MTENGKVHHVTDEGFGEEVIAAKVPVLVDFWAPWCIPCEIIAPALEDLAEEYGSRIKIVKVNVDKYREMADQLGIRTIPAMILFKDGAIIDRIIGVAPKQRLRSLIGQAVSNEG